MNLVANFTMVLLALALAACAESVAPPVSIQALSAEQRMTLRLLDVTAEAKAGVVMTPMAFDRITQRIKANFSAAQPAILVAAGSPGSEGAVNMKLVFTRYDEGSAVARAFLAGLGQIRIDADVFLVDAGGKIIGQYHVSKQYALGGISTRIEDVEEGLAKSVIEIVRPMKA